MGLVEALPQDRIAHDQGRQLALEEAVAPVVLLDHDEGPLHCLQGAGGAFIGDEPVLLQAVGVHLLEDGADDVFLVAEMVVEVAGADAGGGGDMVGGHRPGPLLVEEFDGGFDDPVAGFHGRNFSRWGW